MNNEKFDYINDIDFEEIIKDPLKCYKEYNNIIDLFYKKEEILNKRDDVQYETHHILPKCMGGSNDLSNLVKLPIQFHIICHILLAFSYINDPNIFNKLVYAANCMLYVGEKRSKVLKKDINLQKISKNLKDVLNNFKKQIVSKTIINLETGKIYNSIKECSNELNISIYSISNELRKTKGGKFKYCDKDGNIIDYVQRKSKKIYYIKGKYKVYKNIQECSISENISISNLHTKLMDPNNNTYYYCYDLEGNNLIPKEFSNSKSNKIITPDGTIYDNVSQCSKALGISIYTIYGKIRNNSSGYSFCDDYGNKIKNSLSFNRSKKLIKNIKTGEIYNSVDECSDILGIKKSTIYSKIKNGKDFSYCNESGKLIEVKNKKEVLVKDKTSKIIYKSVKECSKAVGISIFILYKYLRDNNSNFSYCDKDGNEIIKKKQSYTRKIQRVFDGETYKNKKDCLNHNKISSYKLDKELTKSTGEFRWI